MQSPPDRFKRYAKRSAGFTLIELSIVLVVIGLIVGGVLVGQDMIKAAAARSQVTQIERYNTAEHTFQNKYNCIPGDCANGGTFGFPARGAFAGEGDGNGLLQGVKANSANNNYGYCITGGETAVFWVDLSQAGLISDALSAASSTVPVNISGNSSSYFPNAKIGGGNSVYVWSGGWIGMSSGAPGAAGDGNNYFGIEVINASTNNCYPSSDTANIPVQQAYSIDSKVDDGLPQSGRVPTLYDDTLKIWAGNSYDGAPFTTATPGSSSTCFDNGNSAGAIQQYSTEQSGGSGANCTLSFQFQ